MMQHQMTIASTLLLVISAVGASAADQNVWDQCNRTRDADASVARPFFDLKRPARRG
jgi:hypothetical protein